MSFMNKWNEMWHSERRERGRKSNLFLAAFADDFDRQEICQLLPPDVFGFDLYLFCRILCVLAKDRVHEQLDVIRQIDVHGTGLLELESDEPHGLRLGLNVWLRSWFL